MSEPSRDDARAGMLRSLTEGGATGAPEKAFRAICGLALLLPLLLLLVLFADAIRDAGPRMTWQFITSFPSRHADEAGILPALAGTFYLMLLTAAFAIPLGVGAAIYLEEYAKPGRIMNALEVNISNLAGVPSVLYGLLGLEVFVRVMELGRSLVAGAATLALLVLPVVIMASREALRTIPRDIHEAGYALGGDRWRMLRLVVLPMALPGILTGVILSLARAIGETAPLIVVGALTYVSFLPDSPGSQFTALPIQIFNWVSRPQEEFHLNAAAGIVVLLALMVTLNAIAIGLRIRMQKKASWR